MKRATLISGFLTALFLLCPYILRAKVYTIDFNRGTVNGTSIKKTVKGVEPVEFCNAGAELFTLHTSTQNCYYDSNGCGIRVGDAKGLGQALIIIILCDEIQSKDIKKIVIYASRGTKNESASVEIHAGNIATQTISFADMTDYETSASESSNYMLPEFNIGNKFKMIEVEARNTNYVTLHRIDIHTADDSSEDAITAPAAVAETASCYDMTGQRISKPSRGIYIRGGKKYIVIK